MYVLHSKIDTPELSCPTKKDKPKFSALIFDFEMYMQPVQFDHM